MALSHYSIVLISSCLLSGKSDPFCVVRLGTQEQKTDVCEATLNPKWNKKVQILVQLYVKGKGAVLVSSTYCDANMFFIPRLTPLSGIVTPEQLPTAGDIMYYIKLNIVLVVPNMAKYWRGKLLWFPYSTTDK